MAGNSANKAAAARKAALMRFGVIAALVNVLYVVLRLWKLDAEQWVPGWTTLVALAAAAACYWWTVTGLADNAAETRKEEKSEVPLDCFALVVLAQLASVWSGWAWALLLAVPAASAWRLWSSLAPLRAQMKQQAVQAAMAQAAQALKAGDKGAAGRGKGGPAPRTVSRR